MKHILVVDDDASIGEMLSEFFSQHNFRTDVVHDTAGLKRYLLDAIPDVLLIDMNLGHEDGMEIVRALGNRAEIPIFIMSGDRLDEDSRVLGLELGARDYLSKPFSLREVLARITGALAEKRPAVVARTFIFDEWRLSTRLRRLQNPLGSEIRLTTNEFNLLVAFLRAPKRVLSRQDLLMSTRMHDQEIFDRSIDVLVLRLRRKLRQNKNGTDYIRTQRGIGYIFDHDVHLESTTRLLQ